jgi:7-carboxy-7-deazaguanine synthase
MITISEIFGPTIQGEGKFIGRPTVFVRTGSCDYRCSWCDTLYAVLPEHKGEWKRMSTEEVWSEIQRLSPEPILVTLSGGNPALQPLRDLLVLGHRHHYTFCMETQGSVFRPWMTELDALICSPKPPSSGMGTDWQTLEQCLFIYRQVYLKVVVFDENDYQYAREVNRRYPSIPFYLQAGNETVGHFDLAAVLAKLEWLIGRVTQDRWNTVTVLPQLHTILWGNKRGV